MKDIMHYLTEKLHLSKDEVSKSVDTTTKKLLNELDKFLADMKSYDKYFEWYNIEIPEENNITIILPDKAYQYASDICSKIYRRFNEKYVIDDVTYESNDEDDTTIINVLI